MRERESERERGRARERERESERERLVIKDRRNSKKYKIIGEILNYWCPKGICNTEMMCI